MNTTRISCSNSVRFLFLFAFILAATCALIAQSSADTKVITEKQEHSTVLVRKGEIVTIRLASQPGTGYSWQFASDNSKVAALEGQPEIIPQGKAFPGEVESQVFHVRILRDGKAHLELKYVRPWEKEALPAKTFRVTLKTRARK